MYNNLSLVMAVNFPSSLRWSFGRHVIWEIKRNEEGWPVVILICDYLELMLRCPFNLSIKISLLWGTYMPPLRKRRNFWTEECICLCLSFFFPPIVLHKSSWRAYFVLLFFSCWFQLIIGSQEAVEQKGNCKERGWYHNHRAKF